MHGRRPARPLVGGPRGRQLAYRYAYAFAARDVEALETLWADTDTPASAPEIDIHTVRHDSTSGSTASAPPSWRSATTSSTSTTRTRTARRASSKPSPPSTWASSTSSRPGCTTTATSAETAAGSSRRAATCCGSARSSAATRSARSLPNGRPARSAAAPSRTSCRATSASPPRARAARAGPRGTSPGRFDQQHDGEDGDDRHLAEPEDQQHAGCDDCASAGDRPPHEAGPDDVAPHRVREQRFDRSE